MKDGPVCVLECAEDNTNASFEKISKNEAKPRRSRKKGKRKSNSSDNEQSNSPNTILNYFSEPKMNEETESVATTSTPKVDAFQFMMSSRNKVIGLNSPGKEIDYKEESIISTENKKSKAIRNKFLSEWADAKGASKRKRQEEEVANCVAYKLEQRSKKLKEMLKFNSVEEEIDNSSQEVDYIESQKENKKKLKKRNKLSLKKSAIINEVPKSPRSQWKIKIKLNIEDVEDKVKENDINIKKDDTIGNVTVDDGNEEIVVEEVSGKDETLPVIIPEENRRVLRTRRSRINFVEDDSSDEDTKKKKPVKMAPVFIKSAPKPKEDPKIIEARRQFLLSGIPSSLKREMVKQAASLEEVEVDVFPAISHVQQINADHVLWDLPKAELMNIQNFIRFKPPCGLKFDLKLPRNSIETRTKNTEIEHQRYTNKNLRKIIENIKASNPEYPVYKCYKSINSKSGFDSNKKKRQKKRHENPLNQNAMWTEKYKADIPSEIYGNQHAINSLKQWLESYQNRSKNRSDDSESDFDCDSRDSTKSLIGRNITIVRGPHGCGKSSAIYAISKELGFNVLEVNASSKRTGKWLLQELQEATQSHQVKQSSLKTFVNKDNKESNKAEDKRKKCLLLIEDIDVVFEQDDGFLGALNQIAASSKRPIILTTSDITSTNIFKFTGNCNEIEFRALTPSSVAIWLQVLCLIEGVYINQHSLSEILDFYCGDIRRTLLQLQVYVSSGGDLYKRAPKIEYQAIKIDKANTESSVEPNNDDNAQFSDSIKYTKDVKCDFYQHNNCLSSEIDLITPEFVWWNLHKITNLIDFSSNRLNRSIHDDNKTQSSDLKSDERSKLLDLTRLYDNLSYSDILRCKENLNQSLKRCNINIRDGLELNSNTANYSASNELKNELSCDIIESSIGLLYKKRLNVAELDINVPSRDEKRWLSRHFNLENYLEEALPLLSHLDRKSLPLDYFPTLRTMIRSEERRASSNQKRGNRFYNYLRTVGINCSETSYKLACDVFNAELYC